MDLRHARRLLSLAAIAVSLGASCSAGGPIAWPARPFSLSSTESRDVVAARVRAREAARLEPIIGSYAMHGGYLVEGTITERSTGSTWRVRGSAAHGELESGPWGELSLRVADHPEAYFVAQWIPDGCEVSTALPWASTGACDRDAVIVAPSRFEVVVGQAPDAATLLVTLEPAREHCPAWFFEELRRALAGRPGFHDDGARWSWTEEGEEGELVSEDAERCCWDRGSYRATTWIEPRCPGRFGTDVSTGPTERLCAACLEPPAGCRPGPR